MSKKIIGVTVGTTINPKKFGGATDELEEQVRELKELTKVLESLSKVATTGLFGDLEEIWDTEIIFDAGTFDFNMAKLDETKLV